MNYETVLCIYNPTPGFHSVQNGKKGVIIVINSNIIGTI